ncbi:MAG: diguanylate cyclase, partial [Deltaproteobacteria bacterium]|nr:diguanylate cyclase [Deltaproteobacteria bacterium]
VDCPSFAVPPVEILIQIQGITRKTPLIMINRPGQEKTAINCLKHGADYYLVKHDGWEEDIPQVLEGVLLESRQKNQLRKKLSVLQQENQRLRESAAVDEETLFYAPSHFHSVLGRELNRASRHDLNLACLLLDVRHGGEASSSFYEKLALGLKSIVRGSDIWARLDDHRFAAVLPHTTSKQARHAIKRIDTEIAAWNPSPHIRWGVAHFDKNKIKNEADFLSQAEASLGKGNS